MKKILIIISCIFLIVFGISAQDILTFEEALSKTLESNFDIRLSAIDESVAGNNAERSANGYLPTLSGSGGYTWTYYQGANDLVNGEQEFDANNSYNYNAGLTLSYSIFDGFGRKYRFQQASGNKVLSSLQMRAVTENAILQLSQIYHELARLQLQTSSIDSTVAISQQRLMRVEYAYEFGQSTQLDILNAKVDLDTDSVSWLNSRQQLENTKRNLNQVMGVPLENEYIVNAEVQLRRDLQSEQVSQAAITKSSAVMTASQLQEISNLALSSSYSSLYPSLSAFGGYQYRGSDDPNGAFVRGSNSFGPTAGLNLSWTIFSGSNKTQIKNAKLQLERSALALERSKELSKTNALNALGNYENALHVLNSSEGTVNTARNNFDRSDESFKQGQIGSIELRQAQLNLLNAELQLSRALYDAKNSELQVLALMGVLVD